MLYYTIHALCMELYIVQFIAGYLLELRINQFIFHLDAFSLRIDD